MEEDRESATKRLSPHKRDNTPNFSFSGKKCWARLVCAHDGDTITAVLEAFPGMFYKTNVRLKGIDTCEMTSKDVEVKGRAVAARNRVIELLTGLKLEQNTRYTKGRIDAMLAERVYTIWLDCYEQDKYGRTLAFVYPGCNGCASVGDVLLREKLANVYDGGTKR
jgi:endonuclease YncB( thermonuclease family)